MPDSRVLSRGTARGVAESMRQLRLIGISHGAYIDPVNRHRDEYLAGVIDVEEFERRVEVAIRKPLKPDPTKPSRY